ncbi:ARHGB factor, partial [Erithacus rubecula]|nr:ARHGB factor [Erithacus rubecula]
DLGFRAVEGEVFRSLPTLSGSPQLPGSFSMDSQDGEAGLESTEVRGEIWEKFQESPEKNWGKIRKNFDSVFQDLGRLKSRPAHLAVFLRFLLSQADPTPLLFHLCSEVCCQLSSPKESRALARDIWGIFLDRGA